MSGNLLFARILPCASRSPSQVSSIFTYTYPASRMPLDTMALRHDGLTHLRAAGRGGDRAAPRVRSALTTLQVGASVTLVIGAVLLARSVDRLHRVPLGFDPAGVTTFNIYTDPQGYSAARLHALRVEAIGWRPH